MKKMLFGLIVLTVISCNNSTEEKNFSTVDSNIGSPADSNDALLYLDNPQSDSFSIAVDSSTNQKEGDTSFQ